MKVGSALAVISCLLMSLSAAAQDGDGGAPVPARAAMGPTPTTITTIKVPRKPVKTIKTEVPAGKPVRQETPAFRGEGLFFQRCALCHLGEWRKGGPSKAFGPDLTGKAQMPGAEPAIRAIIQNGTANMPGFAHTFTPSDLDDLVAYLKTL